MKQKRKFFKLLPLVAFLLIFKISKSQEIENQKFKNNLNLNIGLSRSYFKDLNFSPLNYKSIASNVELAYNRYTKNNNIFFAKADFSLGILSAKVSSENDADEYLANLEIGYLTDIIANDKIAFHLGGAYHSYLNVVDYDGFESLNFFGLNGVDISSRLSYKIAEKHQYQADISIPVFGLLVRPPYTGWDKYMSDNADDIPKILFQGDFTSINDFFAFNWNNMYSYELSKRWSLVAKHQFRYYRTSQLKKSIIATNQLRIGVNFKF